MASFIGLEAREGLTMIFSSTAITLVVLVAFSNALNVWWNKGLLGSWLADSYPWLF